MARLERDEENDAVKYAIEIGGIALKLELKGQRGFPDRTLLLPGGLVVFVEMKRHTSGSKTSKQQDKCIAKLRALGFTAEV